MTDQPSRQSGADRPPRKPYGPGILILLGVGLLALAAFCFKDVVYPANAAEEWRKEGATFTIYLNWAVMIGGAAGAVYAFALAAKRWKGGAAGAAPPPPAPPEAPEPDEEPGDET